MRLVEIDKLTGNEILAVPVMSPTDQVLIQADTQLRGEYLDRLRSYNLDAVYVKDEETFTAEETFESSENIVKSVLDKHIYKHNNDLKMISEAADRIITSVLSEPEVLESVTEIRNISTDMYSHCINVCIMSTILALRLKMNERQVKNISTGAILHDIGLKFINVPYMDVDIDEMTVENAVEYKKHTIFGYNSIQTENWIPDVAKEIILMHHEQIDGNGFPFRHKGDRLKEEVKLVALCDTFDALISGIGAKKMKIYEAIEYIKVNLGYKFDRTIAEKLLETIAVYPVGTRVITNTGELAIVVRQNRESTDRPVIKLLKMADGTPYTEAKEINMFRVLTVFIVDTL